MKRLSWVCSILDSSAATNSKNDACSCDVDGEARAFASSPFVVAQLQARVDVDTSVACASFFIAIIETSVIPHIVLRNSFFCETSVFASWASRVVQLSYIAQCLRRHVAALHFASKSCCALRCEMLMSKPFPQLNAFVFHSARYCFSEQSTSLCGHPWCGGGGGGGGGGGRAQWQPQLGSWR